VGIFGHKGRPGEPTVEDLERARRRDWLHVSPSQIKTFGVEPADGCASKWYASTVLGLRAPAKPHLETGKRCHAEAERYLETGEAPGPIIAAGLHHLPSPPIDPRYIEQHFAIRDPQLRPLVIGAIDLEWPDAPVALDHKTTTDFRYVRTPEQLSRDPQGVIYGGILAMKRAGATATGEIYHRKQGDELIPYPVFQLSRFTDTPITFRHVYYRTRRPDSRMAEYTFKAGELWSRWADTVRAPVARMTEIVEAEPELVDVDHNLDRCRDYGGCHLRGVCAALGRESLGSASGLFKTKAENKGTEPMSDLLARLRARKAAQGAPPADRETEALDDLSRQNSAAPLPEPQATPPAEPPAEPTPPTINPPDGVAEGQSYTEPGSEPETALNDRDPVIPAELDVPHAGERVIGLKKAQLLEALPAVRDLALAADMEPAAQYTGRCPAAFLKEFKRTALRDDLHGYLKYLDGTWSAEWYLAAKQAANDGGIPSKVADALAQLPVESAAETLQSAAETLQSAAETLQSAAEPVEVVEVAPPPAEARHVEAPTSPEPVEPAEETEPIPELSVLLIDCYPRHLPAVPVYFEQWIAPAVEAVEAELGGDWLAEDYRKGERGVAAALRQLVSADRLQVPAVLVMRRDCPGAEYAIPFLVQLFDVVIEGVR
jgi:hypothetical protein